MVHQCTCKSLSEYMARKAEGQQVERHLFACVIQLWTLKTEGHARAVTLLKVRNKQCTYINDFNLLSDDLNGNFSACWRGFLS